MTIVVMRPRRTAVRWQRSSAGLFKGGVAEASQAEFFNSIGRKRNVRFRAREYGFGHSNSVAA
jgi:hypothetical protein